VVADLFGIPVTVKTAGISYLTDKATSNLVTTAGGPTRAPLQLSGVTT